ncbi:enoyl-CoA hydratase/isomerase [Alkalimonas collagenimarina]|uniref:Enoyl-CoA hydratase/isomerase n=1 Tax=Alkalimonas collagenimarina TaxID=400390 RepID=A0ABT9H0W1_9GAMM|nr:enoyl-CoA hydratase/isomerase [Alkalimonas collagenimarina]MDP4536960.1 enoyl-CoA hydratase/isomerase [Alkalimonas collagenimarina]
MPIVTYEMIKVSHNAEICTLQFNRPNHKNTLNKQMIEECLRVISDCESRSKILVIKGLPEVFCFGADFSWMDKQEYTDNQQGSEHDPSILYALWKRIALGPFISIAVVEGRVNAGGMGFVAACDIVLSGSRAQYSLSELIFGILPACVMPFLIKKIGWQKANYMTLMTAPFNANDVANWGLADTVSDDLDELLRRHLLRLRRLPRDGIIRHKHYMNTLNPQLLEHEPIAVQENRATFSLPTVVTNIGRYVQSGKLPWES